MNDRKKQAEKITADGKAGSKPCDGCCGRFRKISDGVYATPFFLSKQVEEKGNG